MLCDQETSTQGCGVVSWKKDDTNTELIIIWKNLDRMIYNIFHYSNYFLGTVEIVF